MDRRRWSYVRNGERCWFEARFTTDADAHVHLGFAFQAWDRDYEPKQRDLFERIRALNFKMGDVMYEESDDTDQHAVLIYISSLNTQVNDLRRELKQLWSDFCDKYKVEVMSNGRMPQLITWSENGPVKFYNIESWRGPLLYRDEAIRPDIEGVTWVDQRNTITAGQSPVDDSRYRYYPDGLHTMLLCGCSRYCQKPKESKAQSR